MRLLLGGSPCTYWSVAQSPDKRETTSSGQGWELFMAYVSALWRYSPHYFIYENNKSMDRKIRHAIDMEFLKYMERRYILVSHAVIVGAGTKSNPELEIWEFRDPKTFELRSLARHLINSALVSSQNRERYYWTNISGVGQPEDKNILLKDILESGVVGKEKAYCLKHQAGNARDYFKKHHTQIAFEPVCLAQRGRYSDTGNRSKKGNGDIVQYYDAREDGKTNALTTVQKDNAVAEPILIRATKPYKYKPLTNTTVEPLKYNPLDGCDVIASDKNIRCAYKNGGRTAQGYTVTFPTEKAPAVISGQAGRMKIFVPIKLEWHDGKTYPVYEVKDGIITIKGEQYEIKLKDGYYIIRKLSVRECMRLQTIPESYVFPVGDTQAYKMLGNGWTVDVVAHILSYAPGITSEDIEVLSMYDGMSCGHIALDKLGANISKYYASEIDKYCIQTTLANYPDTIMLGDALMWQRWIGKRRQICRECRSMTRQ